jgi:hypothetical protein
LLSIWSQDIGFPFSLTILKRGPLPIGSRGALIFPGQRHHRLAPPSRGSGNVWSIRGDSGTRPDRRTFEGTKVLIFGTRNAREHTPAPDAHTSRLRHG